MLTFIVLCILYIVLIQLFNFKSVQLLLRHPPIQNAN
jgi:hypothetical protein